MRYFLPLFLFLSTFSIHVQAQDTIVRQDTIINPDIKAATYWEKKNSVGFDLNEIAFVNWSAGGVSSVSGLLKGKFTRRYVRDNYKWGNELEIRYGVNKQDGVEWRKTDDAFQFNSNFGYRKDTLSNWYHSAKFSFNTQFTNGYNYPNKKPISKPFAPAYTFLGVGAEYANKEKRTNVYISPLTLKNTLVLDQELANQGAFGVDKGVYDPITGELVTPGKKTKTELGFLVTTHIKRKLYKNIELENKLNLYTDYINKFGNIDVDWQLRIDFVVNEYVKANIGTHLIYDDDIKTKEDNDAGEQITVGPKIQLKQMLGIGLVYDF